MARLELTHPADLDQARRQLYDTIAGGPRAAQRGTVPITDADGRLVGPFAVMLLAPGIGDAMQRVGAALRFRSGLPEREREIAILAVAGVLSCDFEQLAHEPAALAAGLTPTQVSALGEARVPDGLTEAEALVARLAAAMTRDRGLGAADYAAGLEALGREKLAELTWLAGYYASLALALAVFEPELPAGLRRPGS